MEIVFLGGIFPKHLEEEVLSDSKGNVQFAANNLQWNIINGLDRNSSNPVQLCNLMFVGSFPRRYKRLFIRTEVFSHKIGSSDINLGFINLTVVKMISRFFVATRGLVKCLRERKRDQQIVIIYSVSSSFLLAAVFVKFILPKNKFCLVVPDLPEYMSENSSSIYRIMKGIEKILLNFCINRIDAFIVLTKYMVGPLNIVNKPWICLEGVSNIEITKKAYSINTQRKIILYTGTLAIRYGIMNLIEAFGTIEGDEYNLWICGEGDSKEIILNYSQKDSRIKYFGKVSSDVAVSLQKEAMVLVNPRTSQGEFTKYSFPSKIIEYFSSGTPTIMHPLPGIPDEYFNYCYVDETESITGIAKLIIFVCGLSQEERDDKGRQAQEFIKNCKNPDVQGKKIIDFLEEL